MRLRTRKIDTLKKRLLGSWRGKLAVLGGLLLLALPVAFFAFKQLPAAAICECNIFGTPTGQNTFQEGAALELGVKFTPSVNGVITGVRFYKQGAMSGTHTGRLWQIDSTPITSVVFSNETGSGWQTMQFTTPVNVTAGQTYVASVTMGDGRYIATSNYFTSDVTNGPLTAPSSANAGGNGVFNTTGGGFPAQSFGAANYWVDVMFFDSGTPLTVTANTPADNSTGVLPGKALTATFDQALDTSTINSSTFIVEDDNGADVAGTYTYDAPTKTATFKPTNGYTTNTHYNVTLKGGSGTVIKNPAGTALGADYTWSFTTTATNSCPCSLKDRAAPAGTGSYDDSGSVELGVKVKASTGGYITALRFYKPIISTETTHTGNVWSGTGALLASATFSNETEYGWQEAKLSTPLYINEGQVYVISYGSPNATYVASQNVLTGNNIAGGYLTAYADQSSENTATGSGTRNGVFSPSAAGQYPANGSTNGSYYWVDAVFSTSPTAANPLTIDVTQPLANAYGVPRGQQITAKPNRALNGATVTGSTFRLFDASNNQVSGTAAYDSARGMATFTPTTQLSYGQTYTARLAGTVADGNGVTLGSEQSWSFTVGTAVNTNPDTVPGGPILIITNGGDVYSKYYTEILRAEGLNYYDSKELASVDATTLTNYKAVVLAQATLSQSQADMFSNWVSSGGNLIAMRPDSKLASLLGLTVAGSTRTNQYLFIDTTKAPGQGLVNESIQFKGVADNYTLNGATAAATFYSDASTATSNPAVTTRTVGNNGGTAAAFTYDLAKSVIAQHQGNQAWAGTNRDAESTIRANDLFFGNKAGDVQPDWVDLNKIHIAQADEQQRLLANIIIEATRDKQPMPRFGYMPGDYKAAIVMAGDDHGLSNANGTEMILNNWLNNSPTNCSALDWQCVRASHYVYEGSSLTNARAAQYLPYGFEIGDHIDGGCSNYTSYTQLNNIYTASLTTWRAKYTSVPNQVSHRVHCYVWSDWDSPQRVSANNNIRYDLGYVAYPQSWIGTRGPILTGSGMNMRFTDASGAMVDVRQGVTNLDDQAAGVTAGTANALLDSIVNNNFYGIYGTHYDMTNNYDKLLYAATKAHNIPMISSAQALAWWDGRDSSSFSNFTGTNGNYGFTVTSAVGSTGMRAMLPTKDARGTLTGLTLGATTVSYQTQTIKGVEYAVFNAAPGTYAATYDNQLPPDNGGGNSGGGSSGGSQGSTGQGAGTAGTTPRTSRATNGGQEVTALDNQQPTAQTPTETTPPTDDGAQGETPTPTDNDTDTEQPKQNGFDWLPIIIGVGIVILLFILWLFWRRRRPQEQPPLTF